MAKCTTAQEPQAEPATEDWQPARSQEQGPNTEKGASCCLIPVCEACIFPWSLKQVLRIVYINLVNGCALFQLMLLYSTRACV